MKSDTFTFISSVVPALIMLCALAMLAKNFGEISSPQDLLSYNAETGRICFLGESCIVDRAASENLADFLKALIKYYAGFTPFAL